MYSPDFPLAVSEIFRPSSLKPKVPTLRFSSSLNLPFAVPTQNSTWCGKFAWPAQASSSCLAYSYRDLTDSFVVGGEAVFREQVTEAISKTNRLKAVSTFMVDFQPPKKKFRFRRELLIMYI